MDMEKQQAELEWHHRSMDMLRRVWVRHVRRLGRVYWVGLLEQLRWVWQLRRMALVQWLRRVWRLRHHKANSLDESHMGTGQSRRIRKTYSRPTCPRSRGNN
ncbi:hypothetical protein E2C01_017034 [Portunus trituberculatus]|uniref:Uncharacterized protein n=1 Tax=Portunus trituberculatus TaxID=210409 RepID=A0A5B7DSQ2_PORTR|nr:hypothetical protein [Portunus trituberculatus]